MASLCLNRIIKSNKGLRILVFPVESFYSVNENLMLMLTKKFDEWLRPIPMNLALICDVVSHLRQNFLVKVNEVIKRPFANIKSTQGGQEVISNEKAEENKVIDNALKIEWNFHELLQRLIFKLKVFSQD